MPPACTRFIQPHTFLEPSYHHKSYENSMIPTIRMQSGIANHGQWIAECFRHANFFEVALAALIPPPLPFGAYPHYPSHGHTVDFRPIQLLRPRRLRKEYDWKALYASSAMVAWDATTAMLMKCAQSDIRSWVELPLNVECVLCEYIEEQM
jgi:hypothetical protein